MRCAVASSAIALVPLLCAAQASYADAPTGIVIAMTGSSDPPLSVMGEIPANTAFQYEARHPAHLSTLRQLAGSSQYSVATLTLATTDYQVGGAGREHGGMRGIRAPSLLPLPVKAAATAVRSSPAAYRCPPHWPCQSRHRLHRRACAGCLQRRDSDRRRPHGSATRPRRRSRPRAAAIPAVACQCALHAPPHLARSGRSTRDSLYRCAAKRRGRSPSCCTSSEPASRRNVTRAASCNAPRHLAVWLFGAASGKSGTGRTVGLAGSVESHVVLMSAGAQDGQTGGCTAAGFCRRGRCRCSRSASKTGGPSD